MSKYKTLKNDNYDEEIAGANHIHSNWPDDNGIVYERSQSRQHTGTEVAFFDVCYEIPVKENKEKKLKKLLSNVRLEYWLILVDLLVSFYAVSSPCNMVSY